MANHYGNVKKLVLMDNLCGFFCSDHLETTKCLLDGNADVNAKSVEGYTPLMYAANTGRTALAKFLLKLPKIKIHEQVWMSI